LTPRKPKNRPHALLPQAASPGGPNAIRISDFSLIGSTSLTLDDVNKDKFALMKVRARMNTCLSVVCQCV